jgi:hypothetical protein
MAVINYFEFFNEQNIDLFRVTFKIIQILGAESMPK